MDLNGKCVLLGVSGGIAAYKMANVASALRKLGADVEVIMTPQSVYSLSSCILPHFVPSYKPVQRFCCAGGTFALY